MIRCINKHSLLMTVLFFSPTYMKGAENKFIDIKNNSSQNPNAYMLTVYTDNYNKKNYPLNKITEKDGCLDLSLGNQCIIYFDGIKNYVENNGTKEEKTYIKRFVTGIFSIKTINYLNKIIEKEECYVDNKDVESMVSCSNAYFLYQFLRYYNIKNPNATIENNALAKLHQSFFSKDLVPLMREKDNDNPAEYIFLSYFLLKNKNLNQIIDSSQQYSFLQSEQLITFPQDQVNNFMLRFENSTEKQYIDRDAFSKKGLEDLATLIGFLQKDIVDQNYIYLLKTSEIPHKQFVDAYFLIYYLQSYKLLNEEYYILAGRLHEIADTIMSLQNY